MTAAPGATTTSRRAVEAAGLTWEVCESIPVSAAIKLRQGPHRRDRHLQIHAGRRLDADRRRVGRLKGLAELRGVMRALQGRAA